jgi:hypothetical protein
MASFRDLWADLVIGSARNRHQQAVERLPGLLCYYWSREADWQGEIIHPQVVQMQGSLLILERQLDEMDWTCGHTYRTRRFCDDMCCRFSRIQRNSSSHKTSFPQDLYDSQGTPPINASQLSVSSRSERVPQGDRGGLAKESNGPCFSN